MIQLITYDGKSKLLWGKNVFNYMHEKNKVLIGRDIMLSCRSSGRIRVFEGICVTIRAKKFGLLKSSIILRKTLLNVILFIDFPFYFMSNMEYSVLSFSYSRKISCSRLPECRYLM